MLGQFGSEAADLVIDPLMMDYVDFSSAESSDEVLIGLDVGAGGSDPCALVARRGDQIIYSSEWFPHGFDDYSDTASRAITLVQDLGASRLLVDANGFGAGPLALLRTSPISSKVTALMTQENCPIGDEMKFRRLRDWLWWQGRRYMRTNRVSHCIDSKKWEKLKGELSAPSYKVKDKGILQVESKDDLKSRGVRSPNLADAFLMTLFPWRLNSKTARFEEDDARRKRRLKRNSMRRGFMCV